MRIGLLSNVKVMPRVFYSLEIRSGDISFSNPIQVDQNQLFWLVISKSTVPMDVYVRNLLFLAALSVYSKYLRP